MESRKEIIDLILLADKRLKQELDPDEKVELILVGGSALLIKGIINRATLDIDTYLINDNKIRNILKEYNINDDAGRVMTICSDFDDRLEKINLPLEKINLYTLSDYDLIISKIGSQRPKDFEDISNPKLLEKINFDKLEELLKEAILDNPINERRAWSDFRLIKEIANKNKAKNNNKGNELEWLHSQILLRNIKAA
mgnify:CR=1 FL=1